MVAMNRPTPSEYRSVENYIDNEKPLLREEATSFYWKEDLISLRPGREHAWLDATIETFLRKFNCRFIEVGIADSAPEIDGANFSLYSGRFVPRYGLVDCAVHFFFFGADIDSP
jgi:hypothetical protein